MAPVEAPQTQSQEPQGDNPLNKKLSGIIYPPPEVRNIVDKTATFVARNGPSFEERIKQNEINNPKFNFLTPTDPYHAYYRHKVKEVAEGGGQETQISKPSSIPRQQVLAQQEAAKKEEILGKEPPPEPEFIADPPSISAADLDLVKLTAQFVAKNGRTFLATLMNKEQRNYQFDFLRPQHSLFSYFTKLVEQYTKVLLPPKDLLEELKLESGESKGVMKQVNLRVAWTEHQQHEKRREEEIKEKERVAYAQIAWHEFVVVETVDYQPGEVGQFPPPTTPDDVGARILQEERQGDEPEPQQRADSPTRGGNEAEMEMDLSDHEDEGEKDEDSHEESEAEEETAEEKGDEVMGPPPPPQPPQDDQPALSRSEIVVRPYDPKSSKTQPTTSDDQYLISPLTNEKIPANKVLEHMRIGLLDPKWREQKERTIRERSEQETVYATGENIEANLKGIAERRSDIFGTGLEETEIGKKIGEEEERGNEKMIWDGHTASVDKVTKKAIENISIEQQIKVLHQTKGLVDDASKSRIGPAASRPSAPPPPPQRAPAPPPTRDPPPPMRDAPPMRAPPPPQVSAPKSMPSLITQSSSQAPSSSAPAAVPPVPQSVPAPPIGIIQGVAPPSVQPAGVPRPIMMQPGVMMMGAPRPILAPLGPPLGVPAFRPVLPPQPVPVPVSAVRPPPVDLDEPSAKKAKTEDSLIPEPQWLAQRPGPVNVQIVCPSIADKPEWKLTGQTLVFTFNPQAPCSSIKQQIADTLGMPVGKQKLQYEGLFIKDQNSLAFYNFLPTSVVQLSTKERGGRKK